MMQPEDDEGGTSEQQPVEVQNRQSTQSATSAHSYSSTRPQSSSSLRNETERGAKFEFDVTNPEVITDKRTQYILYTIFVKVTNPSGKIELYNVQRRYSEFDWIRAKLTESHPGCIVPPLPSKSLFHRTGKKVVDDRLLGLKKFLDLVVSNSNLAEDEDFHKFFKWNRTNFASFLAANKRTTMQDLSSKLEDAMGDILLENVEESNETYEAVKRNLSALSSSLGNLRSISEKMIASHSELSVARSGVVSAITEHSEPSRELKDILLKTSATMQQISVYDSEMEERLKKDLQPFGYYEKMATSVSDAMKARFAHLVRFCDLEKSLESKTQKLEQAKSEGKQQIVDKLSIEVEQLTKQRNQAYELYESTQASLNNDLELFHVQKERDLLSTAAQVALDHSSHHERNAEKWRFLLSQVSES